MSDWAEVALSEIFDIARGGSPRPIDDFVTDSPDGINWVTIGDASEGSKYITRTKRRIRREGVSRSREVKPGDFLLTNSMSFGKPYIMRTSGCIHDGWLMLSPRRGDVDADFFYHLLGSKRLYSEFERLAAGATVKNLNIDIVRNVKVVLPPLPEQRRIAAILDKADELRAKRRAALKRLDGLTQAMFVKMFGDSAANGQGAPTTRLSSICKRITDGTHQPPQWVPAGIPFLFVSNIVDGQIEFDTQKFISDETHAELTRRCPIEIGDVLYTTVGSYGNAALVSTSRKFAFQRHIAHIKPDGRQVDSGFLAIMLQSVAVRRQADRVARGVAQKTVNLSELSDFTVFLPPLAEQRILTARLRAVDAQKRLHLESQAGLDALFGSLQHQAFTGAL